MVYDIVVRGMIYTVSYCVDGAMARIMATWRT